MTPILFNNNENPAAITYNGQKVSKVYYNNVLVWSAIIEKTGTWTAAALGSHAWPADGNTYPYQKALTGTALGEGMSGKYTYTIKIPIHSNSLSSAAIFSVWINTTGNSSDKTIDFGTYNLTESWANTYFEKTITSDIWLGNNTTIYSFTDSSQKGVACVGKGNPFELTISNI